LESFWNILFQGDGRTLFVSPEAQPPAQTDEGRFQGEHGAIRMALKKLERAD
jgi:hypothetical protein